MIIEKYLNDNFSDTTFLNLKEHFASIGVKVVQEKDLYLFQYDQISVVWSELTEECRGVILRHSDKWEIVSLPHSKFFNFSEARCKISELSDDCKYLEKADGTCIQVWYNSEISEWRCSTLGTITTGTYGASPFTFSELFWRVSKIDTSKLEFGYTHLFELCSVYNAVVNIYSTDRCYYHGSRNIKTGEYSDFYESVKTSSILKPNEFDFSGLTQLEILEAIEAIPSGNEFGSVPEGCVVYKNNKPVAKLKRSEYVSKHGIMTGNPRYVAKCLIELFFIGKLDDVYSTLHQSHKNFAERLAVQVSKWSADIVRLSSKFNEQDSPKEHALKVQALKSSEEVVRMFSDFFFKRQWIFGTRTFTEYLTTKNSYAGNFSTEYKYNFENVLDELKNLYFEGAIDGESEGRSQIST